MSLEPLPIPAMSATHCPVCNAPKDKRWHLVCPACWAKVPAADQADVYELYSTRRGSPAHTKKCRQIVRALYVAEKKATKAISPTQ